MADRVDPVKLKIAQQSAKLFLTQMAAVPADVQLMAVELLVRTIFTTGIQESRRLEVFDMWSRPIRNAINADLKPKKKAGKNGV